MIVCCPFCHRKEEFTYEFKGINIRSAEIIMVCECEKILVIDILFFKDHNDTKVRKFIPDYIG